MNRVFGGLAAGGKEPSSQGTGNRGRKTGLFPSLFHGFTVAGRFRFFGFLTVLVTHLSLVLILGPIYMDMVIISFSVHVVFVLVLSPLVSPSLLVKELRQIEGFVGQIKRGDFSAKLPTGTKAFGDAYNLDPNEIDRLRVSLNWMACQISMREERIRRQCEDAIETRRELEDTVIRDPLTRIYNRQYFRDQANKALAALRRYNRPFAIALLDVDFFKRINDTYGHLVGDQVLVHLANVLMNEVRDVDTVARIGGEEFAILLNDIGELDVFALLERVQTALRRDAVATVDGVPVRVTASIGFVTETAPDGPNVDELIRRSDQALYHVKRNGRNGIMNWFALNQDARMHADAS